MRYNIDGVYLILAVSGEPPVFHSQVVRTSAENALKIFTGRMADFFNSQHQEMMNKAGNEEVTVNHEVAEFLFLVERRQYREAYQSFCEHSRRSALSMCGVYLHRMGNFKKQVIKSLERKEKYENH